MTLTLPWTTRASSGRSVLIPTRPWWNTVSGSCARCQSTSLSLSNCPGLEACGETGKQGPAERQAGERWEAEMGKVGPSCSSPLPKGISLVPSYISQLSAFQPLRIPGCLEFPEILHWASWKLPNPLWTSCLRFLFGFNYPLSCFGAEGSSETLGEPGNGAILLLLLYLRT